MLPVVDQQFASVDAQGWPCVLKHFGQIDDFRSKYLEHGISIIISIGKL
jgi:hypothetical protein